MIASRWIRIASALAAALACLVLPVARAGAAGPNSSPADKFLGGNNVEIPADETVSHDLYVSGGTVRIAGRIDGDLFVFGGNVDVSGPVSGDLFIVGGTVTVDSAVERHLRVLGGNVTFGGTVGQDVLVAAGTLILTSSAHVSGDLILGGGTAEMNGTVDGSVLGSAQAYSNNGRVGGSEQVRLRQQRQQPRPTRTATDELLNQVRRFVGIGLAGLLLILLAPGLFGRAGALVRERPFPSLGIGVVIFLSYFAAMIALLVAMIVLALPLGALGLGALVAAEVIGGLLGMGLLTYAFALALLFITGAVVGLTIGRLVLRRVPAPWAQTDYVPLLLGALIVIVITALPFIGGIANLAVILFGLGGIVIALRPPQRLEGGVPVTQPSP